MPDFITVAALDEIFEDHIDQFAGWLNGDTNYYHIATPKANDASNYGFTFQNVGSGGKALKVLDAAGTTTKLAVADTGVQIGNTPSTTGDLNVTKSFVMKARNAANSADVTALWLDGLDDVLLGHTTAGPTNTFVIGLTTSQLWVGATARVVAEAAGVSFFGAGSYGSGTQVIFIANRTAAPSGSPTGGGILYCESGALKFKGSGGTVSVVANA